MARLRWINADQPAAKIFAEICDMLKASPESRAEEWAVHDYEGFGEIDLCEWPDIERVSVIAQLLTEHGDAFSVWYSTQDAENFAVGELAGKFSDQWQGIHDSESHFASQLLEDCGNLSELPAWAKNYFNFESYARDLRLSGDYNFVNHNGQVFVFSNF